MIYEYLILLMNFDPGGQKNRGQTVLASLPFIAWVNGIAQSRTHFNFITYSDETALLLVVIKWVCMNCIWRQTTLEL